MKLHVRTCYSKLIPSLYSSVTIGAVVLKWDAYLDFKKIVVIDETGSPRAGYSGLRPACSS